ncbi:hypothetical protein AOLI_G00293350 [Acnodon oligacanthus]
MSKGAIVHHGYEKVEVKESKKLIEGKVSFRLSVDAGLAPVVQVLVYCVLPSENVIAASKDFNVEKCFRNKVSLQFSPTEAVPGEENTLQLSAQPGSLCGLSAVDQSVFIMEPGKRLNADEDPVVSKGLSCLKSFIGNLANTYTTAPLAYTFSLAGEHDAREQLLKKLDSIAMVTFTGLGQHQMTLGPWKEISSCVLLAVLTTAEVTDADLGYANRIVSWLVRQQNPYGGFSSTQDTVVALQALALYSTKVFSSDGSSTVTVKSDKESHHFDVNQDNKLLYQERSTTGCSWQIQHFGEGRYLCFCTDGAFLQCPNTG